MVAGMPKKNKGFLGSGMSFGDMASGAASIGSLFAGGGTLGSGSAAQGFMGMFK
jgi:hypothetical protein